MFAVTVTFSIRLGQQTAFMRALETHISEIVAADTGCLRAETLGDPSRPGKVMMVQIFASEAEFDQFRASPTARRFDSDVIDIVTARAIATWNEVFEARRET